jgi:Zn-dependent protease with chaperone function/tetratricopeptide (TPR) repeat protein
VAVLVLGALASAASPVGAQEISNPELFEKSLQAAEQALGYYGRYDDRQEMRRVADVGYRIGAASRFRKFPLSFYLVDMSVPNAFALPGGQIFVTRGMLDLGLDDDMLAGLLGHEIGHVVHEHGIRMQHRATLLNILSSALMVGVMISADGSSRPPDVPNYPGYPRGTSPQGDRVMGAAAAGVVVSELLLRSYGREFEDEADEEGQRLAAAAGFSPKGTRDLMALMAARMPESTEYGYWRTHPFLDQRARAAEVRGDYLKVQTPAPDEEYRRTTQAVLLEWREKKPLKPPAGAGAPGRPEPHAPAPTGAAPTEPLDLIKIAALSAWPRGPAAESLRLERLHRARDAQMAKRELARDLGHLIVSYREELEEVRGLDPGTSFLPALEREIGGFEAQIEQLYPKAVEVLAGGVFETEFLEVFESNYPQAPEIPSVAQSLGDAYGRLARPADAVRQYLKSWRADPDSELGRRARTGLRNLTPTLERLAALQELASIDVDPELRALADARLAETTKSFKELANGADYLKSYPDGPYAPAVTRRLNDIADNLYGEVVLYQAVGDHAKALERIQRILTQAPLSPAAERLRERAVLQS